MYSGISFLYWPLYREINWNSQHYLDLFLQKSATTLSNTYILVACMHNLCIAATYCVSLVFFVSSVPTCTCHHSTVCWKGVMDGAVVVMDENGWNILVLWCYKTAWAVYVIAMNCVCAKLFYHCLLSDTVIVASPTGDVKSMLEKRKRPTLYHYFSDFKDSERAGLILSNAKYILSSVLSGLQHLHSQTLNIMHRDIKCEWKEGLGSSVNLNGWVGAIREGWGSEVGVTVFGLWVSLHVTHGEFVWVTS